MENASKALLMAGGILLGILILALMVTLFASTSSLSTRYEKTKQEEMVQQFNSNFTQFLGKDITIHDVVTICNFAAFNSNKVKKVNVTGTYDKEQIAIDLKEINDKYKSGSVVDNKKAVIFYSLTIESYDENGYISSISFDRGAVQVVDK